MGSQAVSTVNTEPYIYEHVAAPVITGWSEVTVRLQRPVQTAVTVSTVYEVSDVDTVKEFLITQLKICFTWDTLHTDWWKVVELKKL